MTASRKVWRWPRRGWWMVSRLLYRSPGWRRRRLSASTSRRRACTRPCCRSAAKYSVSSCITSSAQAIRVEAMAPIRSPSEPATVYSAVKVLQPPDPLSTLSGPNTAVSLSVSAVDETASLPLLTPVAAQDVPAEACVVRRVDEERGAALVAQRQPVVGGGVRRYLCRRSTNRGLLRLQGRVGAGLLRHRAELDGQQVAVERVGAAEVVAARRTGHRAVHELERGRPPGRGVERRA